MPETSRLLQVAALQFLIGALEGLNVLRQRRRRRSPAEDRDAASKTLLALTWWPPGLAALLAARLLPFWNIPRAHQGAAFRVGMLLACVGVLIRQWSIATLGTYFVGEVIIQPEQQVISRGPYRWVRHPSYTGLWLEIVGIGIASGSVVGLVTCVLVPLIGILRRIHGEEQELMARLPGYREYARERRRLVPHVW